MNKMVFLSNLISFEIMIKIDMIICFLKSYIFFKNYLNVIFFVFIFIYLNWIVIVIVLLNIFS